MVGDYAVKFVLTASLGLVFTVSLATCSVSAQADLKQSEPKLVAQFYEMDKEWNKVTVDLLLIELSKDPTGWMYIRVKDDKRLLQRLQALRKATAFRKLDETRLTYLIGDADGYDVESFFSRVGDETNICEGCVTIRAVDFDELDKLFRVRRIARRR